MRLAHEKHVAGREVEHGREVGKVAGPVSPGGHEAGEVAEGALRPDVESAFVWIARRKFDDRKRERRVEKQSQAPIQMTMELGPAAAAVAIQRRLMPVTT
jgi:hypothetical protein